jgi:hypothetical protein
MRFLSSIVLTGYFIFFCFGPAISQISIFGKVLDDASGDPLVGASVYINNSTIGSSTSADGSFLLGPASPGVYDIIVSNVSYESMMYRITLSDKDRKVIFRMKGKATQMRSILIMTDEMRRRRMDVLRKQFLGITMAASKTKITNEADIMFESGESSGEIVAFTETPLIIVNNELGYRIYFDLQKFYIDEKGNRTYFFGYARYEDLDKGKEKKWERQRLRYYLGSTMHFFHSLHSGQLAENHFQVFQIKDVEGVNAKAMMPVSQSLLVQTDSVNHANYLDIKGSYAVQYLKEPYYKAELLRRELVHGAIRGGVESTIDMLEYPAYLDQNGLLENPMAIQYGGFWSYEKLANMLPINYRPK